MLTNEQAWPYVVGCAIGAVPGCDPTVQSCAEDVPASATPGQLVCGKFQFSEAMKGYACVTGTILADPQKVSAQVESAMTTLKNAGWIIGVYNVTTNGIEDFFPTPTTQTVQVMMGHADSATNGTDANAAQQALSDALSKEGSTLSVLESWAGEVNQQIIEQTAKDIKTDAEKAAKKAADAANWLEKNKTLALVGVGALAALLVWMKLK